MADLRSLSRDFLTEFIEMYRENPCLWQIKSKDYSNKQKKNAAYAKLVKKLEEVEKNATKESAVKKINSLRTCFRKEYRKVLASERSGVGTDELYIPTLWYYELLTFLLEQEEPKPSRSTISDDEGDDVQEEQNTQSLGPEAETQQSNEETNETQRSDYESDPLSPTVDRSRTPSSTTVVAHRSRSGSRAPSSNGGKRMKKADAVLDIVAQKLQAPNPIREFDNFAHHVAEQLREPSVEP
ncbi:uncharacterized protein LOC116169675 isoform X2 [Photinus pyralis]|uniref:uncharacterized protein LOC116159729 isoform X2 n=1 Tax=Photinus pyralis TaxID=7054 RepID=UPI001267005F|nr:uncharacterized protein LOC116159729 isoform X2 [Photinus pyralis]XP_031328834.1 uncharacterized protein LOC116159883 isoform X2 [Photinus pyralis]XP_031329052.1 uncharacterized protein LOC116160060 isoform X2 [Photinus pyralis]XP_031341684.1 uncharacterized protein LOC116169675 isoform X2 [Photinus pyralis]